MKLLSISTAWHDSNLSYFDGNTVHYFKVERNTQVKHQAIKSLEEFLPIIKHNYGVDFDDISIVVNNIDGMPFKFNLKHNNILSKNILEIQHHYAHKLSSTFFSENEPDISIIIDGQGGANCWCVYKKDVLVDKGLVSECGSIGHAMTGLGKLFNMSGHGLDAPGKIMGLQSFGNIDYNYLTKLQEYDMRSIGSTKPDRNKPQVLGDKLFSYANWEKHKGELAEETKLDWLRTLHYRCGEILLEFFQKYAKPNDVIHYSGGVAQNVIWNTLLKKHFKNLVILPHVSDEGLSLGGLELLRIKNNLPKFKLNNFPFCQSDESTDNVTDDTLKQTAKFLADGKIIAWYQGNGEIGPRALGNRSILMDPRISNGKDIINKVKNREYYRPFGASILSEHAKEYFDLDFENPYMLYVGVTQKDNLQSITHVDGTCRVQTVETGHFRKLLEYFYELTGCPVLLNTSLNVSGKPIAGHISDAVEEFNNKNIDVLVIGNEILIK